MDNISAIESIKQVDIFPLNARRPSTTHQSLLRRNTTAEGHEAISEQSCQEAGKEPSSHISDQCILQDTPRARTSAAAGDLDHCSTHRKLHGFPGTEDERHKKGLHENNDQMDGPQNSRSDRTTTSQVEGTTLLTRGGLPTDVEPTTIKGGYKSTDRRRCVDSGSMVQAHKNKDAHSPTELPGLVEKCVPLNNRRTPPNQSTQFDTGAVRLFGRRRCLGRRGAVGDTTNRPIELSRILQHSPLSGSSIHLSVTILQETPNNIETSSSKSSDCESDEVQTTARVSAPSGKLQTTATSPRKNPDEGRLQPTTTPDTKSTKQETTGDKLPLYTPNTAKLTMSQIQSLLLETSTTESDYVMKWLSSREHYIAMMRSHKSSTRRRFVNQFPDCEVQQLINANIIEEAVTDDIKCHTKAATTDEPAKNRRRMLFETRCINEASREKADHLMKVVLPHLNEVQTTCAKYKNCLAVDFRSFFYQIPLHESIRDFFGVTFNGKSFRLKVLPMGATFAVSIAQILAQCMLRRALLKILPNFHCTVRQDSVDHDAEMATLTYIDNLFIFSNSDIPFHLLPNEAFTAEVGERSECSEQPLDILGQTIHLGKKTARLVDRFWRKHQWMTKNPNYPAHVTLQEWLSLMATLLYCAQILHLPVCRWFHTMKLLSSECSKFLLGKLLIEAVQLDEDVRDELKIITNNIIETEEVDISSLRRDATSAEMVIFTDASDKGGGFVALQKDTLTVASWDWSNENSHIGEKEAAAISKALEIMNPQNATKVLCDNAGVVQSLWKGRSKNTFTNQIINDLAGRNHHIWVGWIRSDENAADGPSRGKRVDIDHTHRQCAAMSSATQLWYSDAWRTAGAAIPIISKVDVTNLDIQTTRVRTACSKNKDTPNVVD